MRLPSKKLLESVFGFEIEPITGQQLIENSFGYKHGIKTKCSPLIPNDDWIVLNNNIITFGYKDKRPEVLKNIPEGVFTHKSINVYELAYKCIKSFNLNSLGSHEPEVIFKICDYILSKAKKKNQKREISLNSLEELIRNEELDLNPDFGNLMISHNGKIIFVELLYNDNRMCYPTDDVFVWSITTKNGVEKKGVDHYELLVLLESFLK